MSDKPIIFSGPMVRAIIEGRKTQTRRLINPQPHIRPELVEQASGQIHWAVFNGDEEAYRVPVRYRVGDRLWVRETWAKVGDIDDDIHACPDLRIQAYYRADAVDPERQRWRPSIHMPRWASRLTLIVEDVRVERLQDISHEDAIAEGMLWQDPTDADRQWAKRFAEENGGDDHVDGVWIAPGTRQGWGETKAERDRPQWGPTASFAFRCLWDSLNAKRAPWADNPWVVALTFRAVQANIDRMEDEE